MSRLTDLMTPGSKEVVIRTSDGKAQTLHNMQGIEKMELPAAAGSITLETAAARPSVSR